MNRQGFLKSLFAVAATPAVAKLLPAAMVVAKAPAVKPVTTYIADAVIVQYADYCNYSYLNWNIPQPSKKERQFMYVPLA